MKGWLDKYGKELNANEGHSSAPDNWRGEGYSNVGRNYSPAWGGQFEEGGEIPKAQKGKRTPVYVNDPNDPRLKLYNDSASVFRASQSPWFYPGSNITTEADYRKKDKLDNEFPHWSFDEDQYKKDKKKKIFKDFNDYMYDVTLVDKGDRRATDAFNRNIGKDYEDLETPVETKLPDGRIKRIWGKYKGKLDDSHFDIYDPVTGSTSFYTNMHDGSAPNFMGLSNSNINPISHIYRALDKPQNAGEFHVSSEDSEYVNKVLKNKSKKKKDYTNYTYGTTDNEVYKEPVQPVIYNKKKYNPSDPRLKQLQESFDKFHGGIKGNSKGKSKEEPKQQEEPSLKKKVTKMEPIPFNGQSSTPQLRTIEQPNIELPAVQMGKYRTSYYDPEMKDWNERAFMTQKESDQFADEMSKRGYPGAYGNVTQRTQYQLGGNVYPVNYVPQAQDGITSKDGMLDNIYSKWPALKKLGDVSIKADESFTRDKTGVGDIEFFSPNTPQVTYSNGYVAQNPGAGGYGILYNPSTNDEQNVRLDMLHGMAEADPRYRRLRNRFERAVGHTNIKDEMNHWYNIDKEKGEAEDGREKWMDNYTDGQLRTLLYEGDRSKQNYSDEEANQLLSHPRVKRKFNKLNNYLQKGEFGGSIPGSVGFTYARTNSPAPSNGPYAKKTKASAQNGDKYSKNKEQVVDQLSNLPIYSPDQRYSEYQSNIQDWTSNVRKTPVEVNYNSPAQGSSYYGHGAPFYDSTFPYQGTIQLDDRQFDNVQTPDRVIGHELRHAAFDSDKFIPQWMGDALYNTARNPNEFEQGAHQNKLRERASMLVGTRQNALDELGLPANSKISEDQFNYWARQPLETALRTGRIPDQYNDVKETFSGARNASDVRNLINFENIPSKENGGMTYYQHGLDWKPKSISKNGGWLDKYIPEAQIGWHSELSDIPQKEQPQLKASNTPIVKDKNYGKKVDPYVGIIAKETAAKQAERNKDLAKKAAISAGIATVIVTGGAAAPYIAPALEAPLLGSIGTNAGLTSLTGNNLLVGLGGWNLANNLNNGTIANRFINAKDWKDYTTGTVETALDVAGALPMAGSAIKGIPSALSDLKNLKQEAIYNAIDPADYGAKQKILSAPKTFFKNILDPEGRAERIGKILDQGWGSNDVIRQGQNRLDSWRLGLGLDQKYGTFTRTPEGYYSINSMEPTPEKLVMLHNDIQAHNFQNSKSFYTGRNPLEILTERYGRITEPYLFNDPKYNPKNFDIEPWEQRRIVGKYADNPNFDSYIFDSDKEHNIMGGYRWDVKKMTDGNLHFQSNDTWDLHPWKKRGFFATEHLKDRTGLFDQMARKNENKFLENIEALKLLGGKPFDIQNNFIVDPKTYKIIHKYKEGGVIKDDRGQWDHPGEITEIGSNRITMQGVPYPVLGISDLGDTQMMYPGEEYKFKGKKVTEFPMAQDGTRMPIYTTDPKKIKNYNDSLTLYNNTKWLKDLKFDGSRTIGSEQPIYGGLETPSDVINDPDADWNYYNRINKNIKPISYLHEYYVGSNGHRESTPMDRRVALYKKPVQPYILKKEEEPTLKRKPVKMETIKSKSSTSTPGLKTMSGTPVKEQPVPKRGEYRVSYYNPDIKDWSEQAFETEKESNQFADEMSKRGYGGSAGNVTQTRKVNKKENGGWLDTYK